MKGKIGRILQQGDDWQFIIRDADTDLLLATGIRDSKAKALTAIRRRRHGATMAIHVNGMFHELHNQ